jgi:nucleotide-binding universal stress UspA family protein
MRYNELSAPVGVGIDGSQAAVNAALWAATRALHRDVPLRLIHVVPTDGERTETNGSVPLERECGAAALRAASAAVESTAPVDAPR